MPSKYFTVFDTNIPFRYITQGEPAISHEDWETFCGMVERDEVTLLVPEVVLYELEKKYREFEPALTVKLQAIDKAVEQAIKSSLWNEMADILPFLKDQTKRYKQEKCLEAARRHDRVQALLQGPKAVRLPFDHHVIFQANIRKLKGRTAHPDQSVGADLFILESLHRHFPSFEPVDQLLFCTENSKDYGLEVEKKWTFHPEMGTGLPPVELVKDLSSLVLFLKGKKTVQEPEQAKVEKALQREKIKEAEMSLIDYKIPNPKHRLRYTITNSDGSKEYMVLPSGEEIEYRPSTTHFGLVFSIKELPGNGVAVGTLGTPSFTSFVKTLLTGLGEVEGPRRVRSEVGNLFRIVVSSRAERPLPCWVVRDFLARDGSIAISQEANKYVDKKHSDDVKARSRKRNKGSPPEG